MEVIVKEVHKQECESLGVYTQMLCPLESEFKILPLLRVLLCMTHV